MKKVEDFRWEERMTVSTLVKSFNKIGFQSTEIGKAAEVIVKMKKNSANIFLTFTSNMTTSGLRGFFAQLIELGLVQNIVTTVGSIEEDIMKAYNEEFIIGKFNYDDIELYEKGINRVGNIFIRNESYARFEDIITGMLKKIYAEKSRWAISDLLNKMGSLMTDKHSILYQAWKNNVKIFCPGITDGSLGFHLFMLQKKQTDFIVDPVKDFENILLATNQDEKKGIISLGGSISKHHAILSCLLNGGLDYAVYLTTARSASGSMSGATTEEAKSWGKIKDDSDAVTVIGDVTCTFPLTMVNVLDKLKEEGLLNDR